MINEVPTLNDSLWYFDASGNMLTFPINMTLAASSVFAAPTKATALFSDVSKMYVVCQGDDKYDVVIN
jgi:hypothetical protein